MSANRLDGETSPYLLQHRDNPVDWYPWGPEALDRARSEDKPILLSIGYAACHWCHVMAHESFENPDVAAVMNRHFVSIKVDREERPDLDNIYQTALALLGEQGGWPLTMFLTPDGEPFWGGTYFPPTPRFGRPGFPQVLASLAAAYDGKVEAIGKNVAALRDALTSLSTPQPGGAVSLDRITQAAQALAREIDPFEGGIGGAPKFPQPTIMKLLWRSSLRTGQAPFRQAVELTLRRMSQGGIYDHLGGGFARYAVDEKWVVPHFEKMLYDNAQLIDLLSWAAQSGRDPLFIERLRETVDWMLREMMAERAPGGPACGAFASSLDADSEGEEGRFYVWSEDEIDRALGDLAPLFKRAYDVRPHGNWEGKTILNRSADPELGAPDVEAQLVAGRSALLALRDDRVRPGWDDKVLADWNGLAIAALARAGAAARQTAWLDAAARAFAFVRDEMTRDGRLFHAWRHGTLKHPATLDDYANMCDAALALFETTGDAGYLTQARVWLAVLDRHYWDEDRGGFFLTADDTEGLIVRVKTAQDNAVPAGNGTIAAVLARLYYLTGDDSHRERAQAIVAAFSGELERNIFPYASLLNACELLQDAVQVTLLGQAANGPLQRLRDAYFSAFSPTTILLTVDSTHDLPAGHPAFGKTTADGQATAFVCRGPTCSLPITEPQALKEALWACRG